VDDRVHRVDQQRACPLRPPRSREAAQVVEVTDPPAAFDRTAYSCTDEPPDPGRVRGGDAGARDDRGHDAVVAVQPVVAERQLGRQRPVDPQPGAVLELELARRHPGTAVRPGDDHRVAAVGDGLARGHVHGGEQLPGVLAQLVVVPKAS
jgi:hypothetical protein